MNTPEATLRAFARRLLWTCALRTGLRWLAWWFVAWGVVTMAARISMIASPTAIAWGLLGGAPVALAAFFYEWRRRPGDAALRAVCDLHNHSGGLLMTGRAASAAGWDRELPALAVPGVRWQGRRTWGFFAATLVFALLTLAIPDRYAAFGRQRSLAIGQTVAELETQIEALQEEKILKDKKAEELKQELAKLAHDATGNDPAKTWEALDHLKAANTELAKQAAEEAIAKTAKLAQAETLAAATSQLPDNAAGRETATKAMQELASLLQNAKLDAGLLASELPPGLLAAAKAGGLTPEQLKELIKSLQANKGQLSDTLKKLSELKLIDPAQLGKCEKAGECKNPNGLAAFLAENGSKTEGLLLLLEQYSAATGGVSDDPPGNTPMTIGDPSSEEGAKFKPQALPPGSLAALKDAQRIGLSKSAPEVTGTRETAQSGALTGAGAGGGEAHTQVILPRHKAAVQRFFKREN